MLKSSGNRGSRSISINISYNNVHTHNMMTDHQNPANLVPNNNYSYRPNQKRSNSIKLDQRSDLEMVISNDEVII